ncbi:MAG TPA: DUF3253 domain-containing protein [Tepidisphaeraceae bacterium]|jgi:hypothetical protein
MTPKPSKPCLRCGREMTWRKKWERNWEAVKYCSDACRRHTPSAIDAALEAAIIDLLTRRDAGASACPSEAARAVRAVGWEPLMEAARRAGRRLAQAAVIDVTQGGRTVDPSSARGPIRYRRGRRWGGRASIPAAAADR